jgi:hypothetical protein
MIIFKHNTHKQRAHDAIVWFKCHRARLCARATLYGKAHLPRQSLEAGC